MIIIFQELSNKTNIKVHLPSGEYVDNQVIHPKANIQLNYYSYLQQLKGIIAVLKWIKQANSKNNHVHTSL